MIAAIYARKSTDQNGVGDEEKSVTRQIEHAKAYAAQKGWTVHDEYMYVDDGISGAEFVKRPGVLRLMNALKPKPPFQVLIMSEESRLGIESRYLLTGLAQCGRCGGSLIVHSRASGGRRANAYLCSYHHLRGSTVCPGRVGPPAGPDQRGGPAKPSSRRCCIPRSSGARCAGSSTSWAPPPTPWSLIKRASRRSSRCWNRRLTRLTAAVAQGGDLKPLLDGIQAREQRRRALQTELAGLEGLRPVGAGQKRRGLTRRLLPVVATWLPNGKGPWSHTHLWPARRLRVGHALLTVTRHHTVGMVPPSMTISVPVIVDARSEATNATSSATSSGRFGRPSGMPPSMSINRCRAVV